jgi:hemerythrin-like domain-containing protein
MPYRLISQQMLLEHEVVARVSDALRTAIGWSHHGGVSRKAESVRFLGESFQRHLERMLDLEEHGGYLELLAKSHPQLGGELKRLGQEHEQFRYQIDAALARLEQLSDPNQAELDQVLDELTSLLAQIDSHNKSEMRLLQEVVLNPE